MTNTCDHRVRRGGQVAVSVIMALTLMSCGGGGASKLETSHARKSPPSQWVVAVGSTRIAREAYEHWMEIGAATVELPKRGAKPQVITYTPPAFTACVAQLKAGAPPGLSASVLLAQCRATYHGIQTRILGFLITGYWLRNDAAETHLTVSRTEVRRRFADERRLHYPTWESFHRLEQTSHQSVADLEFAVETAMLSARLLERFAKARGDAKNEQSAIPAFNKSIVSKWTPATDCQPGYVVPDCRQYRAPTKVTSSK
jgi:hypothetical protein